MLYFPKKRIVLKMIHVHCSVGFIFQVYQTKLFRSPKKAFLCFVNGVIYTSIPFANIRSNMDPKKVDGFGQGIVLSTFGDFCWEMVF